MDQRKAWRFAAPFLAAVLLAEPVLAEPSPAPATPAETATAYPFAIGLTLSPEALRARYRHLSGTPATLGLMSPTCNTDVGKQARRAYADALRRMTTMAATAAELEVSSVSADLDFDAEGWHAVVEHELLLRTPGGQEIGRWNVRGREQIVGLGENAIPAAFERAAATAALHFESKFERPAGVQQWLLERGVEPGATPRPTAPAELPPPPPPPRPPRGQQLIGYLDIGQSDIPTHVTARYMVPPFGSYTTSHSQTASTFEARLGVSGRWAFVQLLMSKWQVTRLSGDDPRRLWSPLEMTTLGFEGGPLLRLTPHIELAAGAGLLSSSGDSRIAFDGGPSTSVFVGVRFAPPIGLFGMRARFAVEARAPLGHRFETDRVGNSFGGFTLEVGRQFVLLLGLETNFPPDELLATPPDTPASRRE